MSLQSLINCYVHGIIRRSQGLHNMNPFEQFNFFECRKKIKQGLQTFEWLFLGLDSHIINVVMQMGDKFLADGNAQIALEFYREARHLFPHAGICYIREAQCKTVLNSCYVSGGITKTTSKTVGETNDEKLDEATGGIEQSATKDITPSAASAKVANTVTEAITSKQLKREQMAKEKKLNEASGGIEQSATKDISQNTASAKVKGSKQLKREQMARDKEIEREIEKAKKQQEEEVGKRKEVEARKRKEQEKRDTKLRKQEEVEARNRNEQEERENKLRKQEEMEARNRKEQEERENKLRKQEEVEARNRNEQEERENKLRKQEEVEVRKRKEQEEREKKLRKQQEVEAHQGKEREENKQKLEKQKNDERKKQQEQTEECLKTKSLKACDDNKVNNVKTSLDDTPTNFDHVLSTGSHLRRICPTCNTPQVFSSQICNSCKSRLVLWYREVNTSNWTNPRKPPKCTAEPYQCKHFKKSKKCVKIPCMFAHGQDEAEIWTLCYGKGANKKKKATSSTTTTSSQDFDISLVKEHEKLRCKFCDIMFSSMSQLEYHCSDHQHRVNVIKSQQLNTKSAMKVRPAPDGVYMGRYKLCRRFEQGHCYFGNKCTFAHGREECAYWITSYQRRAQYLAQLRKERVLPESFSEKVRRRIKHKGEHVLKDDLPGVTVNCSPQWQVKLDGPQDHMWEFDVRIQTKYKLLLSQVSFLWETHLDKFKFLCSPGKNHSSNMQSIRLLKEDFDEDSAKQESVVQFCIQFSSSVFGDFQQKLVFDFGHDSVLARSLCVSVISEDICSSKEEPSTRTTHCSILEWSVEKMELVLCEDLIGMDSGGLCEQYSIPNVLPDPAEFVGFKPETYCKQWHDILFIEEQHIQTEIARYDIQNGAMKIVNSFQSAVESVFARPGEFFGEIYLSDYLVMDEVAGHLIKRSVMSVILRPKVGHFQSDRVYECSIKLKTYQLVIVKLNEVLCKDYGFKNDQVICIDLKFRYNRLPMCEMHQAIDMCKKKTQVLLPNVETVSYKYKKLNHSGFMDKKPNTNQDKAITMILDPSLTPPILMIGPFGTGKTFTLSLACVSIIGQSERNKVLICTHTNSAANIHLAHLDAKIQAKPPFSIRPLRVLGLHLKVTTVPDELRKYCLIEETTNVIKEPSWNEIRDHNVIITTLVTARMLWKFYQNERLRFTHILIDEAAQALEPECLTPLVMADGNTKIVLAGDHKQMGLRVYSKCRWAEDFGLKISLVERLHTHYEQYNNTSSNLKSSSVKDKPPYVVLLFENYRCHAKILEFPSDCFYGGELIAKGDQSTHDLVPVLSFYTAQGVDQQVEGSLAYYNDAEVAEVVKRVEELVHLWPKDWSKSIGVVTPYRDQVERIRHGLRKKGLGDVHVGTVEGVQGKEFKALFISTVRTMKTCSWIEGRNSDLSELDFGFLSDPRFLNAAVTRAQSLLAVVGDPMSLCSVGECRNLWK
ncbi:probable helicase with zinc finger domain isoform X2, partial [Paramuricea clavata]